MKKSIHISYLVTIICLLSSITLSAQNYTPFPTDNAEWSVLKSDLDISGLLETTHYTLDGDTTILGENYSKLYTSVELNGANAIYHGGIREESRMVYFLPVNATEEVLLYDFNIAVGDVLFIESGDQCGVSLKEITAINLPNGEVRNKYTFEYFSINNDSTTTVLGDWQYYWIEGIGSTRGLFKDTGAIHICLVSEPNPAYFYLLCYNENGEELFSNENFTSCFLTTDTDDLEIDLGLKLYPNPTANHQFHLEADTHLPNAEIRLYNPLGQLLSTEKWTAHQQTFALPYSGLFYVSIFSEGRVVTTKAIVAE